MRQVRWALILSLALALACLEFVFLSQAAYIAAGVALALGAGWGTALWRRSRWFNLAFAALALQAVYAAFEPSPAFLALAALTFALVAWDLSEFDLVLDQYDPLPDADRLARPHLERVALLAFAGFALGCLALLLKLRLGFELAVFLGLLIFLGLAQVIRFLRSISD
jgi:hypothetical protein